MPPGKRVPKGMAKPLPPGQILTDLRKNQWRLGPLIGQGGFGYLYLGSDKISSEVTDSAAYVIKMEPHSNGPLFVELAFYQRAAKQEMISSWMKSQKLVHLGVPKYIGSGSFEIGDCKYRFMIMDRFGQDVEKLFLESSKKFPLQTVFSLGLRMIDALEYLHEQDYVHADIKASNMLVGFGKKNSQLVFLVDYGLAFRYCPNGEHVPFKEDPKRKHDGTVEYTSRDAHRGLAPSRRGDLEILGYCMLQWIIGTLPWESNLSNKDFVMQEKNKFMKDIPRSLNKILGSSGVPAQLEEFFKYINKIDYTEKPDYAKIKKWFCDALKNIGHADDGKSVYFAKSSTEKKGPGLKVANGSTKKRAVGKRKSEADEENSSLQEEPTVVLKKTRGKKQTERKQPQRQSSSEESPKKKKGKRSISTSPKKLGRNTRSTSNSPNKDQKVSPKKVKRLGSPPKRKATLRSEAGKAGIESTRRRVRKNKDVSKVDFAQSP